jgi:hypothetical protein
MEKVESIMQSDDPIIEAPELKIDNILNDIFDE